MNYKVNLLKQNLKEQEKEVDNFKKQIKILDKLEATKAENSDLYNMKRKLEADHVLKEDL
jgi:ferritin